LFYLCFSQVWKNSKSQQAIDLRPIA